MKNRFEKSKADLSLIELDEIDPLSIYIDNRSSPILRIFNVIISLVRFIILTFFSFVFSFVVMSIPAMSDIAYYTLSLLLGVALSWLMLWGSKRFGFGPQIEIDV